MLYHVSNFTTATVYSCFDVTVKSQGALSNLKVFYTSVVYGGTLLINMSYAHGRRGYLVTNIVISRHSCEL